MKTEYKYKYYGVFFSLTYAENPLIFVQINIEMCMYDGYGTTD